MVVSGGIYQCYMLVWYDDDGLGVGDPLQSIRDIVVVGHTPKHIRVPPEKKTSTYVRTPDPSLRINWKFNLLSVNERFAIVKLNWSTIFKVDDLRVNKVGKRCQLVLQHFGQLGRVNKLWGSNSSRIFSTNKIVIVGNCLLAMYKPSAKATSSGRKTSLP